MRSSVAAILVGALAMAGAVHAAQASRSVAQGYLGEIEALAVGEAPPSQQGCENGEQRDDSGACPIVDDSDSKNRGFTLFSGSTSRPQGPAPQAATPTAKAVAQVRPAQPASEVFRCGQFCDLKIGFKPGSSVLTPESEARLAKFADALRDAPLARKRFEIAGHTDASGSADKNLQLSQARAEAVKVFLVARGVAASRLEAKGYGAEGLALPGQPLDPRNRRMEARALN